MKINDVVKDYLSEALTASAPAEYQQMTDFVKNNRTAGVPADQQVALVLFKELQKQKQQNQALSSELSAAEERINQALDSGELSQQELGMHRAELDRERAAGDQQQAAVGQLGQQYADRDKASRQQINDLTDKLEIVKNTPGVNQDSVNKLEQQIKDLGKNGVGADKVQELERSIAAIQNAESADDAAIKDLIAQVKAAQDATAELSKTRAVAGKDAKETARQALDQVAQLKQDLEKLQKVEAGLRSELEQLSVNQEETDATLFDIESQSIPWTIDNINQLKIALANKQAPTPAPAPVPQQPPPPPPASNEPKFTPRQQEIGKKLGLSGDLTNPNLKFAESAFKRSVAWATGKIK